MGAVMPLERQHEAPPAPRRIEPGCDRPAAEGDERCPLHQVRLGARPSSPSSPRGAPALVVDSALDASVAVPRPRPPARAARYRQGMLAFAAGTAGFWRALWASLRYDPRVGPSLYAFFALWLALGGLAVWGAGRAMLCSSSMARRAAAVVCFVAACVPELLAAVIVLAVLVEQLAL